MAYDGVIDTDLAYTAGIIDGEGNIGIYANMSRKHNPVLKLRVRVNSTDEWLVHWLKQTYGGSVGYADLGTRLGKNWKPVWWWTISCRKALLFIEAVLPYLRMKKPQAEIAIRFQQRHYRGHQMKDAEYAIAEAESILIKQLNKRGIR